MDIIAMTRELAKAIQADPRYINLTATREKNDADEKLQDQIGEFNLKRVELNQEVSKTDRDQEKLSRLDTAIKDLYREIMSNPNMIAFNDAKNEMDQLMNYINQILVLSVNGEDPDTIEPSSCTGSCSTCGGCH